MIDHVIAPDDAPLLTRPHQRAFPGFLLSRLGEAFLVQFYLGFINGPTAVVVVSRDGVGGPQGVVVGTTDPVCFFRRLLRRQLLGFAAAPAKAVMTNPAVPTRFFEAITYRGDTSVERDGALLSSICVETNLSGRGISSSLITAWIRRAKAMGAQDAFLTTDAADNEPSIDGTGVRVGSSRIRSSPLQAGR